MSRDGGASGERAPGPGGGGGIGGGGWARDGGGGGHVTGEPAGGGRVTWCRARASGGRWLAGSRGRGARAARRGEGGAARVTWCGRPPAPPPL